MGNIITKSAVVGNTNANAENSSQETTRRGAAAAAAALASPTSNIVIISKAPVPEVIPLSDDTSSLVSAISEPTMSVDLNLPISKFRCRPWCGIRLYSDLIKEGISYLDKGDGDATVNVIMIYECPSSASTETSFCNSQVFPIHDHPPGITVCKTVLGPLKYSMMNGSSYPSYLKEKPPAGLIEHWHNTLHLPLPTFCHEIPSTTKVYAHLPVEHILKHVHDPHVHYHLSGKDTLHLVMPQHTPRRLANTKDHRPCIAKVTHSMASSQGIFVIRNDEDELKFHKFIESSGNPSFIVTESVAPVQRNLSCHFFIHPSGEMIWFGTSEHLKTPDDTWCQDSILKMQEQDDLRDLLLVYARTVADYCRALGFWGFCGIDVLIQAGSGKVYIVDLMPRTTGTCPALMVATLFQRQYGYHVGIFRWASNYAFPGSAKELIQQVEECNVKGRRQGRIVVASLYEASPAKTLVNIGVYGNDLEECRRVLNHFAKPVAPTAS
jgi:hypothetical protein